jgi:RNA polymerase sigma-70 factor, ECF subfamily
MHRPHLERFCRRMSSAEAHEDVLQDVYLTIVRSIATFRGESAFLTWAYAVCRSCAARWHERQRRLLPASTAAAEELPAAPESARSSRVEAGQVVRLALVKLSPLDRDILVMRDAEGMSAAEVAAETGLTVSAVKTRLHRARVAARARITELDPLALAA